MLLIKSIIEYTGNLCPKLPIFSYFGGKYWFDNTIGIRYLNPYWPKLAWTYCRITDDTICCYLSPAVIPLSFLLDSLTKGTSYFPHQKNYLLNYWNLKGFVVKPRHTNDADRKTAVELNGQYLVFEDSTINFVDDISGWTASNWLARTGNGISMDGTFLTIRNNTITNVDHGIYGGATDSLVSGNCIINFRGDGIRGLGDRMVYEYNTIKNAYEVDSNHDDGFQSWSVRRWWCRNRRGAGCRASGEYHYKFRKS